MTVLKLLPTLRHSQRTTSSQSTNTVYWGTLPLCGMPIMIDSTPRRVDTSMTCFIAGIKISQPSRPKRFSDDHFFAKKFSNLFTNKHVTQTRMYVYIYVSRYDINSTLLKPLFLGSLFISIAINIFYFRTGYNIHNNNI